MSSYSFQGLSRTWTPRDEEENRAIFSYRRKETGRIPMPSEFQPVYLENAEHEVEKWSVQRLICLLRFYGAHRCLWDTCDADYRSREQRKAALIDITAALGEGVTQEQVVQKINVLRATYRYEKRRIKRRIRNGIGARTKLKWFALADAFLRHVPRTEKSRKQQEHDSDSDLEDTVVSTIDPETLVPLEEDEQLSMQQVKTEPTDYCYDHTPTEPTKAPWTAMESLQFVQLLKEHPILWSTQQWPSESATEEQAAITEVANFMQLPSERIRKRVYAFRRAYRMEQAQMQHNPNYTCGYVWWPLAQSFMANSAVDSQPKPLAHFVDTNDFPPATPFNAQLKQEIDVPIPSSFASLATLDEEALEPGNSRPEVATKLICNGLEDDLLEGKWSLKHSVKFLRLYGAHRCLWDLNDPDYRSRELRSAAIADIGCAMGRLNADFVAKKIKIFRITYMQHRKRMLADIKQDKKPEIQLRWFPLADCFLRPHIGLRCIKRQEREMPQFDYQYVYANLNLIDPALLTDFRGKGTQNTIEIGNDGDSEMRAAQVAAYNPW